MERSKRCVALATVASACAWCGGLRAQVDALTLNEAKQVLSLVPSVARESKECPFFELTGEARLSFTIWAYVACPPKDLQGSPMIGHYRVNRRTGVVARDSEGDTLRAGVPADPSLNTPAVMSLAKKLIERARGRVLSAAESRCLALAAVDGGGSQVGEARVLAGVERVEGGVPLVDYQIEHPYQFMGRTGNAMWSVEVDRSSFTVRNRSTGQMLSSDRSRRLGSALLVLRSPPELSAEDALQIALRVPALAPSPSGGCPTLYSGGSADPVGAVSVGHSGPCLGIAESGALVAYVDAATGAVVDPRTGRSISSPESSALAREIVQRLAGARGVAQKEVEAACPGR